MYIKKILVTVAILSVVALGIFSYFIYEAVFLSNTSFSEETKEIYIPTGSTYTEVREKLKPLVKDIEDLDMVAEKKAYPSNVRAGRYLLKKGMNNNEIINELRINNRPVMVSFNNQERLEDLAGRISVQIEADSVELLQAMKDTSFLKKHEYSLENALSMYVPNTYEFFWNTSGEEFRERMQTESQKFWSSERLAKAEEIGLSPKEVITLASIVQKETVKRDERPKVAGVYMNRLQDGWKLEADPTVIYALKKTTGTFDTIIKRVLYKDLELDSPYNTYMYAGLPPGPITMPDISSIDAVLNYEDHDYFYFVADVENFGYHKFAETLAQHNRNKRQYVRWLNAQDILR